MIAKKRGPARFTVSGYSAAYRNDITWKVEVTQSGVTARRVIDGRELSIGWRELFGAAMFYGVDSLRGNTRGEEKL